MKKSLRLYIIDAVIEFFNSFYAFLAVANLRTRRVPIIKTAPMGRTIIQLFTNPAIMYATKDTAATVNA